jgi:D-3-phosphoglycerate dehydrogenase
MVFKVVNTIKTPGVTYGEEALAPFDYTMVEGRWTTESELIEHCRGADGIICAGPMQEWTPKVLASLPNCRIIATLSIGYDQIADAQATEMGMAVTNNPDYCVDEVSNQAMALLMALNRRLFSIAKAVREERISISPGNNEVLKRFPISRLQGRTLGIIGFGKIGTSVALKARGFGLRIIAYDPYVFGAVMRSHGVEPADLDALLRESDFISINCILNTETRGMIGEREFTRMKPTCYLINTARAGMIDELALVDALRTNRIAGAGIDVTADEPLPLDNPLTKLSNCILTGHSAWYSEASYSPAEFWHKPMKQLAMAFKGIWPTYAVNPEAKERFFKKWAKAD